MKAAMAARDDKAIAALLAPDFVSVDVSGQNINAAQMIQEIDALPQDSHKVSATTLLSVKQSGNTVTVNQRYDIKTVKSGVLGDTRNIEMVALSTDTWVKRDGSWLMQRTKTNQMDYYVNGVQLIHRTSSPQQD